jgi:hypothetical protein
MGLLGNGWDDPQSSANMALAAGLLQGNLGAGFAGAESSLRQCSGHRAQAPTGASSQMDNFASEIEARKLKTIQDQRQQSMIEGMFPGLMGGPSGPMALPLVLLRWPGAPQMPPSCGPWWCLRC